MRRPCDACSTEYEAKRPSSKYCSAKCRNRVARGLVIDLPASDGPKVEGSVTAATRKALAEVERLDTPLGAALMTLAERIDSRQDTGSALASLTKEYRASLEAATAGVVQAQSPLDRARDELARRREMRGA